MKKMRRALALLGGFALLASAAPAFALTNQATGQISAKLVVPITIEAKSTLTFGIFTSDSDGGTLVLSTAGVPSSEDGITSIGGAPKQGTFEVTGTKYMPYTIALPDAAEITDGVHKMIVNNFKSDPTAGSDKGLLDSNGKQTLNVGATLTVPAEHFDGIYAGTYNVTVNY